MSRTTRPEIHPSAYLCQGAVVIGQVTIEEECFIGPNAVLRGDIEPITLRKGANVQDCCTLHTHSGNPVEIGEGASIGHGAVVHGATIGAHAIVGMNATVLDNAIVGQRSIIGAGAVVPERFEVPDRSLAVGVPCKVIREDDDGVAESAYQNGQRYLGYRREHMDDRWATVVGAGALHGDRD